MAQVEIRMPKFPDCWESCGNCAQGEVFVSEVNVRVGDALNFDDCVIVLETGKVALDIPSPCAGTVLAVFVNLADRLEAGQLLCTLETE
ncbi:MAG: dihydrolipoamide acyltransferase [Proteobacteria bacterium]|nr:dihydrolipoamide acyltransferase [Pseudomonadota bacterium]